MSSYNTVHENAILPIQHENSKGGTQIRLSNRKGHPMCNKIIFLQNALNAHRTVRTAKCLVSADTWRNNNLIITSKQRSNVVLAL